MAETLTTDFNIEDALGDIDRIEAKFDMFAPILVQELDDQIEQVATRFRNALVQNINTSDIDKESGDFITSWEVNKGKPLTYTVESDAMTRDGEYKLAPILEFGTKQKNYTIEGNPTLYFEPEPGTWSEYPLAAQNADGTIEIGEVEHPGVDGYEYFSKTLEGGDWQEQLDQAIERAIERAKNKADL